MSSSYHELPNPKEMEGRHLLDNPSACVNRHYDADGGPADPRQFVFSTEGGKQIAGPDAQVAVNEKEVEAVRKYGHMEFSVQLDGGY